MNNYSNRNNNIIEYSFNELEFNLYELLDLPITCSIDEIKKKFKKTIKKFHPDKISEIEEKLYYNITTAHHILSNPITRKKYDDWLLNSNMNHNSLKNNFAKEINDVKSFFPKTPKEAQQSFVKTSMKLAERHGNYVEDNRSISSIYKEKEIIRRNIPEIVNENFSNMKEFNKKFSERKINGVYCDKLVKNENNIIPFKFGENNNFTEIKNFDKIYIKDTQLEEAFTLLSIDEIDYGENGENTDNIENKISEYNNNTRELNGKKISLDDIGL